MSFFFFKCTATTAIYTYCHTLSRHDALPIGRHRVLGAVAVQAPDGRRAEALVTTAVVFKRLSQDELEDYLAGGEWRGKAGGYAIQGAAAAFIPKVIGSYPNVVGLPLVETCNLLAGLGYRRSEEHTSELQSLMPKPYAVFCMQTKTKTIEQTQ